MYFGERRAAGPSVPRNSRLAKSSRTKRSVMSRESFTVALVGSANPTILLCVADGSHKTGEPILDRLLSAEIKGSSRRLKFETR